MAKQLNVKLNFQADTSQVQQALASLTTSLSSISNITPTVGNKLTQDLSIAKKSAQDLQMHLNNAFNVKTGNLDLGKLDASLKSSGQSLGQLSSNLLKAGTQGEQAFLNIQRAIGNASIQINQANGALTSFLTTLKNTARWQISSSILHGFMGALQSAWGYAKDLDKSLNNIRIVTGYSSDKMADFAEQANKAAKALSTTTTKYTDASLIFYQQGLSDEDVLKRTEVTIKMANAAGQSAQVVSDQLTAVWNNFYDGSKPLEYYADVMTALGAATASSTDEIAGGLEKFAAIGETIGLSYEYAAAALATITSNTRQSEEVVGTALKTIFARIQGLKLGETLEDGVTLNKYSEALQSVGISIFEQNGELKKMDDILDEMGEKWNTLSKAQQTALAQTVAGTRQYTQLVALMKDWDSGDNDSMMANLETAYNSEGALQEQADIYADSWEAAVDRVKASTEGIYRDLFPTEELTGLMDGFATLLEGIDGLVRGFGGLQGILLLVSSIALNSFRNQIGGAIDELISKVGGGLTNAFSNLSSTFQSGGILAGLKQMVGYNGNIINQTQTLSTEMRQASDSTQTMSDKMALTEANMERGVSQALKMSMEMTKSAQQAETMDASFGEYNSNLMSINNIQAVIERSTKYLTKEQQEQLVILQEQAQAANEQLLTARQLADEAERKKNALLETPGDQGSDLDRYVSGTPQTPEDGSKIAYTSDLMNTKSIQDIVQAGLDMYNTTREVGNAWAENSIVLDTYKNHLALAFDNTVDLNAINKEAKATFAGLVDAGADVEEAIKNCAEGSDDMGAALDGALKKMSGTNMGKKIASDIRQAAEEAGGLSKNSTLVKEKIAAATKDMHTFGIATGSSEKNMLNIKNSVLDTRAATQGVSTAAENLNNKFAQVTNTLQNALNSSMSFGKIVTGLASSFSSVAMGINAVSNAIETINDEDASFTSKLTAGAMAATMGMRGLMAALGVVNTFIKSVQISLSLSNGVQAINNILTKESVDLNTKEGLARAASLIVQKLNVAEDKKEAATNAALNMLKEKGVKATYKQVAADYANVASQAAKYWYITLIIAAVAALAAGIYFLVTAEDEETKALKQAQEVLKQTTETYEMAKTAVEEFKESLSDYQDGINSLEALAGKTNELREAVDSVNEKAKELIETYDLFDSYTYGKFGEIIIDPAALEVAEKQLMAQKSTAENLLYISKINVTKAQDAIDSSKLLSEAKSKFTYTQARGYVTRNKQGTKTKIYSDDYYDPNTTEASPYVAASGGKKEQRGIEKSRAQLSDKELQGLAKAISDTKESLGDMPLTAEAVIETIKKSGDAYGLSNTAMMDLTGIINNETIFALEDFSDSLLEGSKAVAYYVNQIAKSEVEEVYGKTYEAAATDSDGNVNEQLYAGMLAAGTNFAKNNVKVGGNTLEEKIDAIDVSGVTTNNGLNKYKDKNGKNYDIANDKDLGITYATDYLGWDAEDVSYKKGTGEGTITNAKTGQSLTLDDKFMRQGLAQMGLVDEITEGFNSALDSQMKDFNTAMTDTVQNAKNDAVANTILSAVSSESGEIDYNSLVHQISPSELIKMNEGGMAQDEIMSALGLDNDDLAAMGLENGEAFVKGFGEAVANYDAEEFYENMQAEASSLAGIKSQQEGFNEDDTESIQNYAKHLMSIAEDSDELADSLIDDAEAASDLAVQITKMNRGIDTLADNFGDWNDVLKKSSKTSKEYSDAMTGMKKALSDVLDVEEKYISDTFVTDHLSDIEKAAKGDAEAIDRLHAALGRQIVLDIVGVEKFENLPNNLKTAIQTMENIVANTKLDIGETIELNADGIDSTGFIDACNGVISAAGMTADEAQAYFDSIGYEPEFVMTNVTETAPMYGKKVFTSDPVIDYVDVGDGSKYPYIKEMTTHEEQVYMGEQEQNFVVPELNGDGTPKIKSIRKKATGSMNNYSGSNAGGKSPGSGGGSSGGGSEPKENKKTRKDEVVERYKEINDQIDDAQRKMKDAERAAEGLWGPKRLKEMRKIRAALAEELKLLKQRVNENKDYLKEDQQYLQDTLKNVTGGKLEFEFDENNHNILNYSEVMNALYDELKAAEDAAGETVDADEQKIIDTIKGKIETVEGAVGIYDKTKEELEDSEDLVKDYVLKIQELYLNEKNFEIEIKALVDDSELAKLDYYLGKTDDSIWDMAETGALMSGSGLGGNQRGQLQVYEDQLDSYDERYQNLIKDYTTINPETGQTYINQDQFIQELAKLQSEIYGTLNNVNEMDKTMKHYYGDTLAAASEELSKYTGLMENHNMVLDHYSNLVNLLGKSKDFERMAEVLGAQVSVSKNAAEVSKANYLMLKDEAKQKKDAWEALGKNPGDELTYKEQVIQQQWLDAENAAAEAQDQMLSDAEAWANALVAQLENDLAGLADVLQSNLAGEFGSLTNLTESLERANSLQEEYLTTTNKIYETNKLMNTAQQEIDKTSNSVAKKKLKQFITETEQLQSKNKLSQFELEIRQAEYDLLLAEIALEESQNAKSTVRLQRDSEGNFGYVYTADSSQVDKAQQDLEDAQNALYNIGLEGANRYTESYIQTMQEMNDKVTELTTMFQNGEIKSKEEFDARMLELQEYYGEKLAQYSNLQQIALTTDSRIIDDAWSKDFFHMTTQTEQWMSHVSTYVEGAGKAFDLYQKGIDEIETYISEDLGTIEENTSKITKANEDLEKSITDPNKGLIKALGSEIEKVDELTESYIALRKEMQGTIDDAEGLGDQIATDIANESDDDESNDYKPTNTGNTDGDSNDTGGGKDSPEVKDPKNDGDFTIGDEVKYIGGTYYHTSDGDSPTGSRGPGKKVTVQNIRPDAPYPIAVKSEDSAYGWLKRDQLTAFDTGGYTGDWEGPYGKIAMVHQKELILDEKDTENFLMSLEVMEKIVKMIDLQSANAQYAGNIVSPGFSELQSDTLEQNVHIEASFPNVTDKNEIEEALKDIVNLASQYANRK